MLGSVDLFGLQVAFYDSVKYMCSHMIYSGDNTLKYILLNIPTVVYLSEEHRLETFLLAGVVREENLAEMIFYCNEIFNICSI